MILQHRGDLIVIFMLFFTINISSYGPAGLGIKIRGEINEEGVASILWFPCVECACGIANGMRQQVHKSRSVFNMRIMPVQSVTR